MARYIDADFLKERMYHEAFEKTTDLQRWDSGCWIRYKMFENVIKSIPTADVVEVVRCKDCKHLVRSDGICKVLSNNYEPPVYVDDDDFCSRGERREET